MRTGGATLSEGVLERIVERARGDDELWRALGTLCERTGGDKVCRAVDGVVEQCVLKLCGRPMPWEGGADKIGALLRPYEERADARGRGVGAAGADGGDSGGSLSAVMPRARDARRVQTSSLQGRTLLLKLRGSPSSFPWTVKV